ncbi:polysaccharide biosynthesis protein [Loktanella sp. 5RATIMAR09]|uniref:oligosaccharide flippase family protein n=1 Tax=Loktanella sp. 5RATIMAR09 TaxID=1225655 RepID=UPI0006EB6592|nr:oligosaccharide flippase family protein [Loktanella sp. 5RATIMAR09]KQI73345.1 polysaccharide biosynthesis protein [Loktanella sp. 5RATIMAR09]
MGIRSRLATKTKGLLQGGSLTARVMRSSALTLFGFGFSQGTRLLSNLILTRILFPEAFGLMALVTVLIVGLNMFSDMGISPSIMQSKRGDDPAFLNTAFTIQIIRGVVLFLLGCALAYPVSRFYGEDILFPMMVVACLQFVVTGFTPTRKQTAQRHLLLGRVTLLDAINQVLSLALILALALWMQSVWALVIGGLLGAVIGVVMYSLFLPGERNRLTWDKPAVHELIHFGKWIFLSTAFGFLISQGDRLILGKFLPLDAFGVYVIGFFLGSFAMMLGAAVSDRLLIPVYRDRPPANSRENFIKLRKLRSSITLLIFVPLAIAAFFGPSIVDILYDDRYISAGTIVVLISCFSFPLAIGLTYDSAALAVGNSKAYALLSFTKASLALLGLFIGVSLGGLVGALVGQFLGMIAFYPFLAWLSVRLGTWDPLHDGGFTILGAAIMACAFWIHWPEIVLLATG